MSALFYGNYFYIVLALQGLCVWHCLRRGTQQKWIWIIVFLPLIGCLIYLFSEILPGRNLGNVGAGLGKVVNPSGSIRRLEEQLRFSATHQNQVALADAYLAAGQVEKAIHLYEESLTGPFDENEYVLMRLITAYAQVKFYEGIPPLAERVQRSPQFPRSQAHVEYAKALAALGQTAQAEKEFQSMGGKFANYEPRYQYGCFLAASGRAGAAAALFNEILGEEKHLGARERRQYRAWFAKTREALKGIGQTA